MTREERLEALKSVERRINSVHEHYVLLKTQELIDQKYSDETSKAREELDSLIEERARLIAEGLIQ